MFGQEEAYKGAKKDIAWMVGTRQDPRARKEGSKGVVGPSSAEEKDGPKSGSSMTGGEGTKVVVKAFKPVDPLMA